MFFDSFSLLFSPQVINIGTFTDSDIPLKYCIRLLSSSFLLSGTPGGCIPDRNVRISVKSLALGCLSNIFSLYPSGFFLPLHVNIPGSDTPLGDYKNIAAISFPVQKLSINLFNLFIVSMKSVSNILF